MKNIKYLSIICAFMMILIIPTSVFAADTSEVGSLPDPGMTPDSPFYFMDKWSKHIAMAFTFGAENKAQRSLQYADERMAEFEAMISQDKIQEASEAGDQYQYFLNTAIQNMEQAGERGINAAERLALMAENHLEISNRMSDNATQQGQAIMNQNREQARICQEQALQNMACLDPEAAACLNLQLMERQLDRIQLRSQDSDCEEASKRVEEYNRLGNLGEKISAIARSSGKQSVVDQLIDQATTHHLEFLAQVQQQASGEAIENCMQNQEQSEIRLQSQEQSGIASEETPGKNIYQNGSEQSTQTTTQPVLQTQSQSGQNNSATDSQSVTQTQNQNQSQTNQGAQGECPATETQTMTQNQTETSTNQSTQTGSAPDPTPTNGGQNGSQKGR
jgi:hypothetical protein